MINKLLCVGLMALASLMCGCASTSPQQLLDLNASAAEVLVVEAPLKVFSSPDSVIHPPMAASSVLMMEPTPTASDAETALETAILDKARECKNTKPGKFPRPLLRDMLRIEDAAGVPLIMRGMSLAAACNESGYNPHAQGDHRFSASGKKAKAVGILQQWSWWENSPRGPKINRRDPRQAAKAWVEHIAALVPQAKRQCGFHRAEQLELAWRTAWSTGVLKPRPEPRCQTNFSHLRLFASWRKSWDDKIKSPVLMASQGTPPKR